MNEEKKTFSPTRPCSIYLYCTNVIKTQIQIKLLIHKNPFNLNNKIMKFMNHKKNKCEFALQIRMLNLACIS